MSTDQSDITLKAGDKEYTPEAAIKKIESADQHIAKIEQENATLREQQKKEAENRKGESTVEKLARLLQEGEQTPETSDKTVTPDMPLTPETIEQQVQAAIEKNKRAEAEAKQKEQAEKNQQDIDALLKTRFGDKVEESLLDMELSLEEVKNLGSVPGGMKAVKKLFSGSSSPDPAPSGGIRIAPEGGDNAQKIADLMKVYNDNTVPSSKRNQAFKQANELMNKT